MFCPIKHLSLKDSPTDQCNPHCAWAIGDGTEYACAFAVIAASASSEALSHEVSYNVQEISGRYGRP